MREQRSQWLIGRYSAIMFYSFFFGEELHRNLFERVCFKKFQIESCY